MATCDILTISEIHPGGFVPGGFAFVEHRPYEIVSVAGVPYVISIPTDTGLSRNRGPYVYTDDGAAWVDMSGELKVGGASRNVTSPSLATDQTNLYAAWFERDANSPALGTGLVHIKKWDTATWAELGTGLMAVAGDISDQVKVAAAPPSGGYDGHPFVAWIEYDGGGIPGVYVYEWTGAAWAAVGAQPVGPPPCDQAIEAAALALIVSTDGNPAIVYTDQDGLGSCVGDNLVIEAWDGAAWVETLIPTSDTTFFGTLTTPTANGVTARAVGTSLVWTVNIDVGGGGGTDIFAGTINWDGSASAPYPAVGGMVQYPNTVPQPDGGGQQGYPSPFDVTTAALGEVVSASAFADGLVQDTVRMVGVASGTWQSAGPAWPPFSEADIITGAGSTLTATLLGTNDVFYWAISYKDRLDADATLRVYLLTYVPCTTTPTPASQADVPGLDVCGIEISNPARAFSYLQNGLGGTGWRFGTDCIPSVFFEPDGTPLTFTDVAGNDGGSPAPWFDPDHPDSEEFLGLLLTRLDGFDSTVSRTVTQRAGGIQGGSIGAQHLDARVLTGHGFLVASSCCGLEFGRRWIINTLSSAPCDPCGLCDITVRTCAPPADGSDDDRGRWTLYDVALVDGPHETDRDDCCDWAEIDFTLTAGNPYLYKQKLTCVTATQLQPDTGGSDCVPFEDWFCGPPGTKICCTVNPPLVGTLGAIVTIDASLEAVGGVEIGTYLTCPPDDDTEPAFSLIIPLLVQGSVLVIDSARRVITYTAPDGSVLDGTQFIQFPEGRAMEWIEVSDCSPASCICVNALHPCSGGDQAYVTIQTQLRER